LFKGVAPVVHEICAIEPDCDIRYRLADVPVANVEELAEL
jgi:hypothetical protein